MSKKETNLIVLLGMDYKQTDDGTPKKFTVGKGSRFIFGKPNEKPKTFKVVSGKLTIELGEEVPKDES